MVLAIFLILLAAFVILPIVGVFVVFMLTALVNGIVLGALARLIIPGRQPIGLLATIVSGWVGALAGGALGAAILGRHGHGFGKELIAIGIAAITVLLFTAALRHDQKLYARVAARTHQGHKVIDV